MEKAEIFLTAMTELASPAVSGADLDAAELLVQLSDGSGRREESAASSSSCASAWAPAAALAPAVAENEDEDEDEEGPGRRIRKRYRAVEEVYAETKPIEGRNERRRKRRGHG